jgi:hypothetical protein
VLAPAADVDAALFAGESRERGDRVLDVEAEVAREVVPRPKGDANEGPVVLRGRAGDGRERPIPSGDANRARRLAGQSRRVVLLRDEVDLQPTLPRRSGELLRGRALVPRPRVNQE